MPPLPIPPADPNKPVYALGPAGEFLVDDTGGEAGSDYSVLQAQVSEVLALAAQVQEAKITAELNAMLGLADEMHPLEAGGESALMDYGTNLWLEIPAVTNGIAYVILHNVQQDEVYELMSKRNLGEAVWNPEQALHTVTNQDWIATVVPVLDRTNALFFWARDWTGIDENTNSLPDWWEFENFGDLNQTASGDYDGDGTSNYDEYLLGRDPNTIRFSLMVTNQYNNNNPTPVPFHVSRGVPSSMACVVDSTNLAGATWKAFSTNLAVNLGSEGWHRVWIGLRGRLATSQQTWQNIRLKLDLTPPVLTITNPVSTIVSQPIIQLQGYCAEPLASLNYDLTNAAGISISRQILIIDQDYATNTMEFTTNFFQAFDVPLTNGANTITLHAIDLAGNSTVTNLTFTVDYSSKTNPPTIKLFWPQNNTSISSNNFRWRGWVNDPTAQVIVQTVDTNGTTNSMNGRVDRSGNFFVEAVPLAAGTNLLTLITTDAAGNSCATNISVNKNAVVFTIDHADWSSVSGRLSDPSYTVWINGLQITNYSGGIWWSDDVEFDLDHATIYAQATQNSESGGQPIEAEADLEWPAGVVYLKSYHEQYDDVLIDTPSRRTHEFIDWSETGGGTGNYYYSMAITVGPSEGFLSWVSGKWPHFGPGTQVTVQPAPGTHLIASPGDFEGYEYAEVHSLILGESHSANIQSEAVFVTGGKPGSTDLAVFDITGMVWPPNIFGLALPPEQVVFQNLGQMNTNWHGFVVLPERQVLAVPPRVNATNSIYQYGISGIPHKPHIYFNGQDVTGSNVSVFVGQKISLSCSFPGSLPSDFPPISNYEWTVPGFAISNYVVSASSGIVYSNFPTANSNVFFYWVDGGTKEVECTVKLSGVDGEVTSRTTFIVLRPEATWTLTPKDSVAVDTNYNESPFTGDYFLHCGKRYTTNDVGMQFSYKATDLKGYSDVYQFQFVQIVSVDWKQNLILNGTNMSKSVNMRGLDGGPPYTKWFFSSGFASDSPMTLLFSYQAFVWRKDSFETYLLFKPNGGIPVPIKFATWEWYGRAQQIGTNGVFAGVTPFTNPRPAVGVDTRRFPEWTSYADPDKMPWSYQDGWFPTP